MTQSTLPSRQYAVELTGPDQLELNCDKPVPQPGPHQVLLAIEAVGLCFSDLKLLQQFDGHARKSEVIAGLAPEVLAEIPSYVPGSRHGVPGHEAVGRIVAVGSEVKHHRVGERCLVQTDYRDLKTAGSNAAFGYNFEGALQEYVILDERVIIDRHGERYLIPVGDQQSASAVALVEPWACVEDSYVHRERNRLLPGGRLLVVGRTEDQSADLEACMDPTGKPARATWVAADGLSALADQSFDDIIYFGHDAATIELLNDKLANGGLINIVLGGGRIDRHVNVGVGRVHYGMTRWIGTTGENPAEAYHRMPTVDEIRNGDRILIIGAGGPMGQMHVIRCLCSGMKDIEVVGTDFDDERLASIDAKARPIAEAHRIPLRLVNTQKQPLTDEHFSYIAIMAPVAPLVAQAVVDGAHNGIINIFAGIPAPVKQMLDLDTYIRRNLFMFGTSGSVIEDMKIVLGKLEQGLLDTNTSLDAVAGMQGAADGIAAVKNRTLAGKIVVYPQLRSMGLIPLAQMHEHYPQVAALMDQGKWTRAAEAKLLEVAADQGSIGS